MGYKIYATPSTIEDPFMGYNIYATPSTIEGDPLWSRVSHKFCIVKKGNHILILRSIHPQLFLPQKFLSTKANLLMLIN